MRQHTSATPYPVGEAHFYSTQLESGLVLFDTGPPTAEGEAALAAAVDLARVRYLLVTHCHVDHCGLMSYLLRHSDAEIYIPRLDAVKLTRHAERMAAIEGLLAGYGFGPDFAARLHERFQNGKVFPRVPERYRIVEDAPELEQAGIHHLACPGHSQSDLVYITGGYAVSGDLLLRNIFQAPLLDIDLLTFAERFRNYDAYCASVVKLARLRGLHIMPGHRGSVDGVDQAILFYVTTLMERSAKLSPHRGLAVSEIVERIFTGRLTDPFQVYLKVSEIVFMLDFLEHPELLKASLEEIGLFDRVAELYAGTFR